jgi:heme/copper-type cytochrome/quinol oxidase subunit 2
MPIHIKALPKTEFNNWLAKAKKEFATNETQEKDAPVRLAQAATAR